MRNPILWSCSRLPSECYLIVSCAAKHPKRLPGRSDVRRHSSLRRADSRFRSAWTTHFLCETQDRLLVNEVGHPLLVGDSFELFWSLADSQDDGSADCRRNVVAIEQLGGGEGWAVGDQDSDELTDDVLDALGAAITDSLTTGGMGNSVVPQVAAAIVRAAAIAKRVCGR